MGRTCRRCGSDIDHLSTHAVYCSPLCGAIGRGETPGAPRPRPCVECGETFEPINRTQVACHLHAVRVTNRMRKQRMRENNPEMLTRLRRDYRQRHPEQGRAHKRRSEARRRAMKAGALAISFTAQQLAQRLSMFDGCWICGGPADEVDHVKPLARGGAHCLSNLRPACGACNRAKWATWDGVGAVAQR